jgi:hypothetical protein
MSTPSEGCTGAVVAPAASEEAVGGLGRERWSEWIWAESSSLSKMARSQG